MTAHPVTLYTPDPDALDACRDWHDGQGSTFYAVASTGALTTGSRRPSTVDSYDGGAPVWRPMTDAEWHASLLDALARETRRNLTYALDAGEVADADALRAMLDELDPLVAAADDAVEREAADA